MGQAAVLERLVLERIASDRLALPAMPAMVAQALQLLDRPDSDHRRIVELIEQEPMTAAQVLRLANSAAYTSGAPARTLVAGVRRLGLEATRRLLLDAAARRLYTSPNPRIALGLKRLFHHALAVALLSRELMLLAGDRSGADEGYLCGLLHEIGKPVLATALLEREASATGGWIEAPTWIAWIEQGHRSIGAALAKNWKLSSEVQATIAATDYDSEHPHAPLNFVLLADAMAAREGIDLGRRDPAATSATVMLGSLLLQIDSASLRAAATDLSARASASAV